LGAGADLVGRSHECDTPEWVKGLPVLSRPTFDVTGSSREIDRLVRERLRAGEPLYEIDERLLNELAPDVLITQTHCEVCAVSPADVARGTAAALCRQQVVALRAGTLAGVLDGFLQVARVLRLEARGLELISGIQARLAAVRHDTLQLPHPTVACLEWIDPVFAMGNWGPELVECAGGVNVLGNPGERSAAIPWEEVRAADPDVLVVAPCGFGIGRTLEEMPVLEENVGWEELRAVRSDRVFVADGNLFFNRSGPTMFETPEILAEILHPEVFAPRHEGPWCRHWVGGSRPRGR
jgi:iron complex transport system substrate-binding protein